MATLVMEGFEAGSMDVCSSYGSTATISASHPRTGTYALCIDDYSGDEYAIFDLGANKTEIYFGIGVYLVGGAYAYALFELIDSGGTTQVSFVADSNTQLLKVYRGTGNDTLLDSGGTISLNQHKYIEAHVVIHDSSGVLTVKVDGVQVINYSGDVCNGGTANIRSFRIGYPTAGIVGTAYAHYDDFVVNDTTGSYNNSWTGRGGIELLSPNGAGNSTDLTASAGSNYECVDEQPPDDDTTYVYGSTPDGHDGYTLTNTTQSGTVEAIKWFAYAKTTAAGSDAIKRHLRINGTDYNGASDLNLTTDYAYYKEILEENPDDSAAFETADLDAMEAGVVVR